MFSKTKTALFALAAVATLGAASLASSPAEARGFGGGFHFGGGHIGGGMHFGGGARFGGARFGGFRAGFHPRFAFNHFNRFNHFHRWGFNHCRWGHCGWGRPIIGGGYVAGPSYVAPSYAAAPTQPAAATCTCLRKDYTQDGQVVFQDVCTKEVAAAPAGNQAMGPQQNQQQ